MVFKDFLYYFLDEEGRSYYVDASGEIRLSGTPLPLSVGPDGWKTTTIKWQRNTQGFGNFRRYTTQYKYVREAAKILRDFMYKQGTEGKLFLLVLMLDKSYGGGWKYKKLFKSELDFSTAEDDTHSVAINAMEGGLIKLLKANENTQYDIPLFDNDEVLLRHDGVEIETTGNFTFVEEIEYSYGLYNVSVLPSVAFFNEEGRAPGIDFKTQTAERGGIASSYANNQNWFAQNSNTYPIDLKLTGKIKIFCTQNLISSAGVGLRFRLSSMGSNTPQFDDYTIALIPVQSGETYEYDFSFNIPMVSLDRLFFELIFPGVPTGALDVKVKILEGSFMKAFAVSRKTPTNINAFTPKVLGQKLLDLIAGPGYTFSSAILETHWKGLLVTSEDALRGFEKPYLRTSWSDFFNSYNTVIGLTWNTEGRTLFVKPKAEAFGQTEVLDLGSSDDEGAKEPVVRFADEHQFNSFIIGYPEMKYQDVNGRFEYNTTVEWTSEVKRTVKQLNLVSKYSASIYDQEFTRINFEGKTTTNGQIGTNNYFVNCEPFPVLDPSGLFQYYKIKRGGFSSIEGLLYPDSAFNLDITPLQCLYRHGNYLRAVFYFVQKTKLKFASTKGNRGLITTSLTGVRRAEAEDVEIENLDAPLFIPLELEVETAMPIETVSVMDATPDETISVNALGLTIKGHPVSVEVQPADNGAQKTVLLLSNVNDITKLIRL